MRASYVNNKTTKYLLRAGRVEDAQNVIALFAKHEGDPQYNLFEMQVLFDWVLVEQLQKESFKGEASVLLAGSSPARGLRRPGKQGRELP